MSDLDRMLASITEYPWPVLEYRRWLEEGGGQPGRAADYLFVEEVGRFEPREEDVLVAASGVVLEEERGGLRLRVEEGGASVVAPGISKVAAARLFALMNGQRTAVEIEIAAGSEAKLWRSLLARAFGSLIFAPAAVEALERRLPGTEIVRFPGSPYQVIRNYWENMGAVRERLAARLPTALCGDATCFIQLLRELNVLVLMGADLATFYRPASPIGRKGVTPGALLESSSRVIPTERGFLFLRGPRVNAALLGGGVYCGALFQALGDPAAHEPRAFVEDGTDWGRVVEARTIEEQDFRPWFCPPRPIEPHHWARLQERAQLAWEAGQAGERTVVVEALADFHQRFIQLHPFRCANQSLAMSVVNYILGEAFGAGIPHLTLDHLAFRLSPIAYRRAFAAAVAGHLVTQVGPRARYAELADRKQRLFRLVAELEACGSVADAMALAERHSDRCLACFPDGSP